MPNITLDVATGNVIFLLSKSIFGSRTNAIGLSSSYKLRGSRGLALTDAALVFASFRLLCASANVFVSFSISVVAPFNLLRYSVISASRSAILFSRTARCSPSARWNARYETPIVMIINSRRASGAALMAAKFARIRLRSHATNPWSMPDPHGSWMSLRGYQRTQREPWHAPMSSFPVNELTELGRRRREPSPNRLARPLSPLWRRASGGLGRGRFLLLAATCHRQQERSLAAVGNSLGARRLARGRLLRRRVGILREAALQRIHQIDDLGRLGNLARCALQPFGLSLDQLAQGVLVAVPGRLRVERARAALDDRLGDRHHVGVGLAIRLGAKFGRADLIGGPHGGHHQAAVTRLDQHQPLPARQRDMPEPDLVRLGHRLADDPEGLGRELTVGMDPIGSVEIDRIDRVAIDKAVEVDDLRRLDLQILQLVIADRDIAPAFVLVALDDLIAVDDLAGLGVDELLGHPISGLAVQLVEPDALCLGRRRDQVDRAGHQR